MKQLIGRHAWTPLLLLFVAAGVATTPAAAQDDLGHQITILVPNLAPGEGLRDRFGDRVARELRSGIERMHTHETVSNRDMRSALREYSLRDADLYECITARQLAMQKGWGLVTCGEYEAAGGGEVLVRMSFVGAEDGEAFELDPFTVSERDPQGAAQIILEKFDNFQNQLRRTVFCQQYVDSEQWDQALDNCQRALEINPASRTARYLTAYIFWQQERYDDALAAAEKVLEGDPIHQDALKLAGIVATQKGDRAQARQYFDRYMELNPGDVNVRLSIATDIANAGDPETALRFAQEGLEVAPEDLNLLTYIGHFATNAALRAESRMAEGNSVDPAHIGQLFQTAADAYEQVFEAEGVETDARILERLVIAQFRLGDTERAIELGRRATEALPDNAAIWEAYSRALEEAGQHGEALAAIARTQELGRDTPALAQRRALLQLQQGNRSAAFATLTGAVDREVLERRDAWRIMFRHAHQDHFRAGRLSEAYTVLDQAAPLAYAEEDRLARHFWMGYFLFEQARRAQEPQTAESARRAKPMFERALEHLQAARGYERIEQSANVPGLIDNTRQFIDIQDALIRRGR